MTQNTTSPTEMKYVEASTMNVGDVVRSTQVLETYPTYWIEPGARFVVVEQFLNEMQPQLSLRLVPADQSKMTTGDLTEWGNCVQFYGPEWEGYEHAEGYEEDCAWDEGNMWSIATLPIVKDNDALPLAERLAAVFTKQLADEIGLGNMAAVVRLNAAETSPDVCHSHDFCDANMVMLDATHRLNLMAPVDLMDGNEEHEEACKLWGEAWVIAQRDYFPVYAQPLPMGEADNDDEVEAAPTPPVNVEKAVQACRELIYGADKEGDHLQRVINLAREALGLKN